MRRYQLATSCALVGMAIAFGSGAWQGALCPVAAAETVTYKVVTNEISAKQKNGDKTEVYRFDPAVYVVHQDDDVVLQIRGLKGHDHRVVLEGYDLHNVVHRNETTTLKFKATKAGFFRLICIDHADAGHEGPMEAYVIVTPK